jgi:hypothetical protein
MLPVGATGINQPAILREEHRLRVFENRALRRIYGPKKELKSQEIEENCIM